MDTRGKLFGTEIVNSYLDFNKDSMRCIFILKTRILFIAFTLSLQPQKSPTSNELEQSVT